MPLTDQATRVQGPYPTDLSCAEHSTDAQETLAEQKIKTKQKPKKQ